MLNIKRQICQGKRVGQWALLFLAFCAILLGFSIKISRAQEQSASLTPETVSSESGDISHNQYFETFDRLLAQFNLFRDNFLNTMKQSIPRLLNKIKNAFKRIWDSLFDFKKRQQEEISHKIENKATEEIDTQANQLKETADNYVNNEIDQGTGKIKDRIKEFIFKIFNPGK